MRDKTHITTIVMHDDDGDHMSLATLSSFTDAACVTFLPWSLAWSLPWSQESMIVSHP